MHTAQVHIWMKFHCKWLKIATLFAHMHKMVMGQRWKQCLLHKTLWACRSAIFKTILKLFSFDFYISCSSWSGHQPITVEFHNFMRPRLHYSWWAYWYDHLSICHLSAIYHLSTIYHLSAIYHHRSIIYQLSIICHLSIYLSSAIYHHISIHPCGC